MSIHYPALKGSSPFSAQQDVAGPPRRTAWPMPGRGARAFFLVRTLVGILLLYTIVRLYSSFWPAKGRYQPGLDRVTSLPSEPEPESYSPSSLLPAQQHHQTPSPDTIKAPTPPPPQAAKSKPKPQAVAAPPPPPLPPITPVKGTPKWGAYPVLNRYYGGLMTLVTNATPEYPHSDEQPQIPLDSALFPSQMDSNPAPIPQIHEGHRDQSSHVSQHQQLETCYLDAQETIPVPSLRAFEGNVQGFPDPIMGSYQAIHMDGNKCHDRHSRFGPYGFGHAKSDGGIGAGNERERDGVEQLSSMYPEVNYTGVSWGAAQDRCLEKNKHRFPGHASNTDKQTHVFGEASKDAQVQDGSTRVSTSSKSQLLRTAVILRVWHGFQWTEETVLHMRSMIAELALLSGGQYEIFFLIHVKDSTIPIWSSPESHEQVLRESLPEEFRGMGVLWSEKQMETIYYGLTETLVLNRGIYGVYRSAHFPLQYFASTHPEFEYFWNWEMDIRFTGHWLELFDSLRSFARAQPRKGMWERNERFYVPSVHGSWEDFIHEVQNLTDIPSGDATKGSNEPPVWGRRAAFETPIFPEDPQPPRAYEDDQYEWGVGEEADLITLNPLFNPEGSGWVFINDVTGYKPSQHKLPRRTSIITASRLSRRLLMSMHKETSVFRHTMFDEMWPATVALHHGLKAVYAPHPVFVELSWPPSELAKTFNSGPGNVSGSSPGSPFNVHNEHNFRSATWYYNAIFASRLWYRWFGFDLDKSGRPVVENSSEGRMCLPPMLLHPIKDVKLFAGEK